MHRFSEWQTIFMARRLGKRRHVYTNNLIAGTVRTAMLLTGATGPSSFSFD